MPINQQNPDAPVDNGLDQNGQPIQAVKNIVQADHTGRDWGEGIGMGAAIVGSILSFGIGSVGAVAVGADIAANAAEDAVQNQQDKQAQTVADRK